MEGERSGGRGAKARSNVFVMEGVGVVERDGTGASSPDERGGRHKKEVDSVAEDED